MWQSNIHDTLGGIPSISSKGLDSYFCSIVSQDICLQQVEGCSRVVGAGHLEIKNY